MRGANNIMDWSALQGTILTGGGRLLELYNYPQFPFREDELPHYHKVCILKLSTNHSINQQRPLDAFVMCLWMRKST
jgi:hypothetical protein